MRSISGSFTAFALSVSLLIGAVPLFSESPLDIPCADCHGTQLHDLLATRHAPSLAAQGETTAETLCGACHGEVSAHAAAPKPREVTVQYPLKSLMKTEPARVDARCLSCHTSGDRPKTLEALHLRNGLHCLTCHTGMGKGGVPRLLKAPERELCGTCHAQALAPFRSGHRTDRGQALCTFCHDPHARERGLIARECVSCHRVYAYPKPFEHPPVEGSCLTCHDPHGSQERFLLKEARPALCLDCHSQPEAFHRIDDAQSPFRLYEACQNCHPRIHGSDAQGGIRFQR